MKELEKRYEALGFTNDLIFKYVLTSDIELCKELISRIDPKINTEGIHYGYCPVTPYIVMKCRCSPLLFG